eukprot:4122840-Pleurochrysis_carterae.AAC.1
MKLHVVGVINHRSPSDSVHFFSVEPNLAGGANLNRGCLYRAIKADFEAQGMLPQLHLQQYLDFKFLVPCMSGTVTQVDNASDNKDRWVIGFAAWLIEIGWVEE